MLVRHELATLVIMVFGYVLLWCFGVSKRESFGV